MNENETRMAQTIAMLQQEQLSRAQPRLGEMIDALNIFIRLAQGGNPQAKELLGAWVKTLEDAHAAAVTLTIVRNGPPMQS